MGGASKYKEQAKELELNAHIHFVPFSGEAAVISRFLNALDFFAHGRSDGETFGTVFAEAMVHGKCCLSHKTPHANAQQETMGPAGLFAVDEAEYTYFLEQLFSDRKLREKLCAKARPHAEEYYSLESAVKHLENIYERIMGRASADAYAEPYMYGLSPLGYLQAGDIRSPASIAHHIMTDEIPEAFDVHVFRYFLPHIRTLFDVGANIGLYSCIAAHDAPTCCVHAFEPQNECCEDLRRTILLNNWEERFVVHQTGLGDKEEEKVFFLAGTGSTFDNAFNDDATLCKRIISVKTLDNIVQENNCEVVDFIKIDVEGFELQVLRGALCTIRRDSPVLFVEIADRVRGREYRNPRYAETLAWLQAQGYAIFRCTEDGYLVEVGPDSSHDHIAMYICLSKGHCSAVLSLLMAHCSKWRKDRRMLNKGIVGKVHKIMYCVRQHPMRSVKNVLKKAWEKAKIWRA